RHRDQLVGRPEGGSGRRLDGGDAGADALEVPPDDQCARLPGDRGLRRGGGGPAIIALGVLLGEHGRPNDGSHAAPRNLPLVKAAWMARSGPRSCGLSIDINSTRRVRARKTLLLIVPTAQWHVFAASS